ncbi:MAG TPA: LysR family transcriptional regulator [Solirubrobacteraceae bacterium]|nr:LysR family transcriptional regulator [Solirubrobacteraceae bacterium]
MARLLESPTGLTVFNRGQLRYFVAVAEDGQVTRAAARLHVAQPAISQAIAKLESQLGVKLLNRHPRGVTLTPAGEVFFEKARAAVAAEREALETGESLARGAEGSLVFGTVGLPPWLTDAELVEGFTAARPTVEIRLKEVPFPSTPIASWLADVDVVISTLLSPDGDVWIDPLKTEPRVVLAAKSHPLGRRDELTIAEVLDQTFTRSDAGVDPVWAGNWTLDEYRGGPPPNQIARSAASVQATLATISSGLAISTSPASQAVPIVNAFSGVVAIPLRDARPMVLSLVGRNDRCGRLVEVLRDVARTLVRRREPNLLGPASWDAGPVERRSTTPSDSRSRASSR